MQLTHQQKLNFHRDGHIKISGAIPQLMVEQALCAINHSLGEQGMNKEDLSALRSQSYLWGITKKSSHHRHLQPPTSLYALRVTN